ncbi:MAG: glutathione S-transferase family protein [Gammaproteobacteria bacterium]
MKLYSAEISGNCYKIRLLLSFLKLDYELVPINVANREQKTHAYLQKNPLGEIPSFEDGKLVLRDSQAILVYLARQYSNEDWLPYDANELALVMQWLSTACNEIARGPMDARAHHKFKLDIDINRAQTKSHAILSVIDEHLANKNWLELNRPTIADIACFPYIALSFEGGISLDPYANINNWIIRIKQLPDFISMPGIEKLT